MAIINQEVLEKAGFHYAFKVWSVYSLTWPSRMDTTKKQSCWDYCQRLRAIIYVLISIGFITFIFHGVTVQLLQLIFERNLSLIAFISLLRELTILINIYAYIHTYQSLPKYVHFMQDLASALEQYAPAKMAATRQWIRGLTVVLTLISLICIAYTIYNLFDAPLDDLTQGIFYICIASYCLFYDAWYMALCKILSVLWSTLDSNKQCLRLKLFALKNRRWAKRNSDHSQFLVQHSDICNLIQDMDSIYSSYTFVALAGELTFIVLATQLLVSPEEKNSILIINNAVLHAIFFTLRTLLAASVNEKVTSTLDLASENPTSHLKTFSATEEHYLLYLNEIATIKPQLTYGGILTITKEFIFTVSGTIVTYAIALHDLKGKTEAGKESQSDRNCSSNAINFNTSI